MKIIKFKQIASLGTLFIATVLTFGSCGDEKIDSFVEKPRVWFTQRYRDPNNPKATYKAVNRLSRSFMLYPGEETIDVPFQVNLIGPLADQDRFYTAVIVDSLTTAHPDDYQIQPLVVRANQYLDTLWVKLTKTPRMDLDSARLVLHIVENDTFGQGYYNGLQVSLSYSNLTIQPEWWDKAMTLSYLGVFSKEKFNALYFYCLGVGIEDVSIIATYDRSKLRKLLLGLKKYIVAEGITEADDSAMEIPIY